MADYRAFRYYEVDLLWQEYLDAGARIAVEAKLREVQSAWPYWSADSPYRVWTEGAVEPERCATGWSAARIAWQTCPPWFTTKRR